MIGGKIKKFLIWLKWMLPPPPLPFSKRLDLARQYGDKVRRGEMTESQAREVLRRKRVL